MPACAPISCSIDLLMAMYSNLLRFDKNAQFFICYHRNQRQDNALDQVKRQNANQ